MILSDTILKSWAFAKMPFSLYLSFAKHFSSKYFFSQTLLPLTMVEPNYIFYLKLLRTRREERRATTPAPPPARHAAAFPNRAVPPLPTIRAALHAIHLPPIPRRRFPPPPHHLSQTKELQLLKLEGALQLEEAQHAEEEALALAEMEKTKFRGAHPPGGRQEGARPPGG